MSAKAKTPKYVEEAYEKDGLAVLPLEESERVEWAEPWPGRGRSWKAKRGWKEQPTRCSRYVRQGRASHVCPEAAVAKISTARRGGDYVCARHLAGALRSAANDAHKAAAERATANTQKQTEAKLKELGGKLGIRLNLVYHHGARAYSSTSATVSIADLEKLAERSGG